MTVVINPFADWEPHAYQEAVMECDSRYITIFSGRRGGKTNAAGRKFYDRILEDIENGKGMPYKLPTTTNMEKIKKFRLEYWCVAPIYALTRIQMQELSEVIPQEHILKINLSDKYILLKGYIVIYFKTAENPKNLVGSSVSGMWIDEAAKLKPNVWNGNLRQCMLDTKGWAIFTTTSEGKNWFYYDILCQGQWIDVGGDHEDYKFNISYANFTWSSLDNDKVPGLREEVLERMKEMPKRDIDREIFSRVDVFFGQVYDNFSSDRNIVKQDYIDKLIENNEIKNWYIFKDWGFRNWGVSLLVAELYGGYWIVVDEIYKKDINDYPVADGEDNWLDTDLPWIKQYKVKTIIADNNNPDAIKAYKTLLSKKGITTTIKAVEHSEKLKAPGIKTVRSFFHFPEDEPDYIPKLRINKKCKNLLRELTSYKWKDGLEEPEKKDDHGPDSLRYGIYHFNKNVTPRFTNITKDKVPKILR